MCFLNIASYFNKERKYDIMDYTISETILNNLNETLDIAEKLDESTLHTLFIKITSYIEEERV